MHPKGRGTLKVGKGDSKCKNLLNMPFIERFYIARLPSDSKVHGNVHNVFNILRREGGVVIAN